MRGRKFVLVEGTATRSYATLMTETVPRGEAALDGSPIQRRTRAVVRRDVCIVRSVRIGSRDIAVRNSRMSVAIQARVVTPSLLRVGNAIFRVRDKIGKCWCGEQHQRDDNAGNGQDGSCDHKDPPLYE